MNPVAITFPTHYRRVANAAALAAFAFGAAAAIGVWLIVPVECSGQSPREKPITAIVMLSTFFGVTGISLAALLYLDGREVCWQKMTIEQDRLILHRGDTTQELLLTEIVQATWRCRPIGGALVLATLEEQQVLRLDQIPREQRLTVINSLYGIIPKHVQANWPEFCRRFALPLRRSFEPDRAPGPNERLLTRRRFDLLFGAATPIVLAVVLWVWWYTGTGRGLAIVVFLFGLWALVRFSHPKEGTVVRSKDQPPSARPALFAIFLMLVLAIPLSFAAAYVAKLFDNIIGIIAAILIAASAFLPLVIVSGLYHNADKTWRERKRAEAVAEWNRLADQEASLV